MNDTYSTSEPTPDDYSSASQDFLLNAILFLSSFPLFVMLALFMNSSLSETYVDVCAFAGILLLLVIFVLVTIGHIKITQGRTVLSILCGCLDVLPLLLLILMQWALSGLINGMMVG
jgi:hypothetical protein